MTQDHVATWGEILALPKWANKATTYSTSEMIQTIIVGALPEFFMS